MPAPTEAHARLADAVARGEIGYFLEVWLTEQLLGPEDEKTLHWYYRSYRRHFGAYVRHHYGNQTRELMKLLPQLAAPRVLEVGCGCATESLWMAAHGARVTAVDTSDDFLRIAQLRRRALEDALQRTLPLETRCESIVDLIEEPFDVIWMEQAFHHLEPRRQVVDRVSALLKPGGYLVISENNAWNPLQQLDLIRRRGFKTIIQVGGRPWGHERILSAGRLERHFRRHGIERVSLRFFRALPNRPWADALTARIGMFDDVDRSWLRPLYTHYNYVGRKAA